MISSVITTLRNFLVRSLAVLAVVLVYAFGNVAAHILTIAGISTLGVSTTATPAYAWWRRGWTPSRSRVKTQQNSAGSGTIGSGKQ
jgi:hypothetical protein